MEKKHTLLAITGLNPQVVTETLYGIHKQDLPWPNELIILTTKQGAEQAQLGLLHPNSKRQNSMLDQCCIDLGWPLFSKDKIKIEIVPDHAGQPIDDARTREDQEALADYIVKRVAQLCADEQRTLHASLAGGRKTMTFFLGYAMSLFARPDDRLSHVLIAPAEYEGLRDFYYPTPYTNPINGKGTNQQLDTHEDKVQIMLADIPFIRQREHIGIGVLNHFSKEGTNLTYRQLVALQNIAQSMTTAIEQNKKAIVQHRKAQTKSEKAAVKRKKKTDAMTAVNLENIDQFIKNLEAPLRDLRLDFNLAEKSVDLIYRGEQIIHIDMQGHELSLAFYAMVARHDHPESRNHYCRALANESNKPNQKPERFKSSMDYLRNFVSLYLYELELIVYPEQPCEKPASVVASWQEKLNKECECRGLEQDDITQDNLRGFYRTFKALTDDPKVEFFDQRKSELREFLQTMLPKELVPLIEPDFTYYTNSDSYSPPYQVCFKQDPTMKCDEAKDKIRKSLGLKVDSNLSMAG
ncbi:CRISPR-associated ring nuclease Csm6 [Aeromonas veronii]